MCYLMEREWKGEGTGVGWGGGGGKPLMSYKKRSRFSCCGTPLSVRAISIHSEAYMKSARCWEQV